MGFKETEIGSIPDQWDVVTIEQIGRVVGGGTPSTKKIEYYGGNISWITPKDLSGYSKKRISKGERSITEEGLKNSSAELMPKDTVLLSSRAPIGYVAIASNEISTNQGFKSIICDRDKVLPDFLYYVLKTSKERLEAVAGGSTFKEVSGKVVRGFKIALPPLLVQSQIGSILSKIDDKIELNNHIISNLEQLAQTLFKRWFVDFEFPNEDGEPYKSSGGEMVESELGMIPKGWGISNIEDIADCQNGYAFYKSGYSEKGYKVVDLANVNIHGQFVETGRDKHVSYEILDEDSKMEKYLLKADDLIMIMMDRTQEMNILGKVGRINESGKYVLNQRIFRIRVIDKVYLNFLYTQLSQLEIGK